MLWSVTIFRNFINPFLEEDVQSVYIRTMRVEDGKLVVIDERERTYSVDLKTHAVRRLRKVPPAKAEANHALHRTAAKSRSSDALRLSNAAFAGSARFRRQSVS